ncbi:MAG: proline--tRNA ligase, partial [Endomicrobiia bacterium]|nr:proline--tRNA ligase [Endomicrobiia bacterium]
MYHFSTKFRNELRATGGILRGREFLMKDAYSFHATQEDADKYYEKVFEAYKRICERCGFDYRAVEAATGAIGGKHSHEFMVLAPTGEELIAHCSCGYGANVEKAERPDMFSDGAPATGHSISADVASPVSSAEALKPIEEIHTPSMRSVEEVGRFLKTPPEKFIKTLIYKAGGKTVMVLIRGDRNINEAKLAGRLGAAEIVLASPDAVRDITGAAAGFAGPVPKNKKIDALLADYSVRGIVNGVSGANKTDCHISGINIGRDYTPDDISDLALVGEGDLCPRCRREKLSFSRGIEIGHTFKLGTKYSEALNATFLAADGKQSHFIMGCYGIGVSRMVAAAIEQSSDADGIIWLQSLAPYRVVVIPVDTSDEKILSVAEAIYKKLLAAGVETLLDDRNERPGVKFKDADIIGFPVRVTVGKKLSDGLVEIKLRKEKTSRDVPL